MPSADPSYSAVTGPTLAAPSGPYALFTLDPEGVITSWNSGVRNLLGYEAAEFVRQHVDMIFTLEDRALGVVEDELARARETGDAQQDYWLLHKDGSRVWANCETHTLGDFPDATTGFLTILRHETARPAPASSIERNPDQEESYLRISPTAIAVLEQPALRILDVNRAFAQVFGLDSRQLVGQALSEAGMDLNEARLTHLRSELAQGKHVFMEASFLRQDGEQGAGTFTFEPIMVEDKPHTVMLMRDITKSREVRNRLEAKRQLITAILDSLPGIFYMMDARFRDGPRLVRWNAELERVTGLSAENLERVKPGQVVVDGDKFSDHIDAAFRTGGDSLEGQVRAADGSLVPYLFTARKVTLAGQTFVLGIGKTIHEQIRMREVLERRVREQATFADLSAATLSSEDLTSILALAAQRVAETLNAKEVHIAECLAERSEVCITYPPGGENWNSLSPDHNNRFDSFPSGLPSSDDGTWPKELLESLGHKSGIRARITGPGHRFGFIEALSEQEQSFSAEDVSFLRNVASLLTGVIAESHLRQELAYRADHDDLTGLLKRAAFERRLSDALGSAQRKKKNVAVLFLDMDRFKRINDSFGHQAGDEILHGVAERLRDEVRSFDVVGRLGGDEFALFLPDVDSSTEVAHFAKRLLKTLQAPFDISGHELEVGATVGIATFPADGNDAETLLRAADMAMYEGKLLGRNTMHFFTTEQNERVSKRLKLEADLKHSLRRDEFRVSYQPEVDLSSGAVRVVEALIRWHRPDHGELLPGEFLKVAEDNGLAVPIGEWMLQRAFADHAGWRGLPGAPQRVSVNVSPLHFIQPYFTAKLAELASAEGVMPSEVEIELSEQCLLQDPTVVEEQLLALRELGVHIVLDGFGANFSPFSRLRSLPIERIKLDESFTHDSDDEHGSRLTDAIVQVALSLGVEPVAKGVETESQHHAVRELGFSAAQGRWYAGPCSRDELLAFLRERGDGEKVIARRDPQLRD